MDKRDIVKEIGSRIELIKQDKCYVGLCPFHNGSTQSFSVSPGLSMYYCFYCGSNGGVEKFISLYESLKSNEESSPLVKKRGRKKKL